MVTDVKAFLDAHTVPIKEASIGFESALAPNAARELRGNLSGTFFEKLMNGTMKLTMEFTAAYQIEQGKQFTAFSIWQFNRITWSHFSYRIRSS